MLCPNCQNKTAVVDTRAVRSRVYRHRRCLNKTCKFRFVTRERLFQGPFPWRTGKEPEDA